MFTVSKHKIGDNFEENARKAIRESYANHGSAPNAVLVRPGVTKLASIAIGLGRPAIMHNIPVAVRPDLGNIGAAEDEFELDESRGVFE